MGESRCSTNATKGAFGPPQQSEGARRVQSPEAMAIEDNPPGPTKFSSFCFYSILFFQNRAFRCVFARGHYRGKVVINPSLAKVFLKHHYRTVSVQGTRSMSPPNASGSQKISKRDGCTLWPLGNCSSAKDSSETFSGMDAARSLCSVGSLSS